MKLCFSSNQLAIRLFKIFLLNVHVLLQTTSCNNAAVRDTHFHVAGLQRGMSIVKGIQKVVHCRTGNLLIDILGIFSECEPAVFYDCLCSDRPEEWFQTLGYLLLP